MKKNEQWRAAVLWAIGFIATSFTVLWVAVHAVESLRHVPPELLTNIVSVWKSFSAIIGLAPALMVALGVADDKFVRHFTEYGERMFFFGNVIAWVVWSVIMLVALLFVIAFWGELIGSPDERDGPPEPLYRRVWKWMRGFTLALFIMALPNKEDGEVPD